MLWKKFFQNLGEKQRLTKISFYFPDYLCFVFCLEFGYCNLSFKIIKN